MMPWPQLDKLSPYTHKILLDGEYVPVEKLLLTDISMLENHTVYDARGMIIREFGYVNHKDGEITRNDYYDLYDDHSDPATHCINVFAAKMIRDYREGFSNPGGNDEIRFNYTGIQ